MAGDDIESLRRTIRELKLELADARSELTFCEMRLEDAEAEAYYLDDAQRAQHHANAAALVAIASHVDHVKIGCEPLSLETIEAALESTRKTVHRPV